MGNTILCRNTPCTQPRPVYKTVLSQIFQIGWEKPRMDASNTKNNSMEQNETINRSPSEAVVDIPKLQAHVNSHIKALIDYLEGSHKKLVDTGSYIQKVVTGSFNPDIHMLGLLVNMELIKASPKFTHDKTFLAKLHQRATNEEFIKAEGNEKSENKLPSKPQDLENSSFVDFGSNLKDNVAYFDNSLIETLAFLLDEKRNLLRKSSYRYTLKTLDLYAKNHPNAMTSDKMDHIMTNAFEMIELYPNLNNMEDLEVEHDFMTLLVTMAKSNNVAFKFKHKFINHSYKTLKSIYEIQKNGAPALEVGSLDRKEVEQQIVKLAFEFIETISKSVYDLNEFGILISPLFTFLDNIEWQDSQLQADIFMSLLNSMSNSSFDQADVFVIEKIVEYINFNKNASAVVLSPYKHNEDIEVKIRVFSLLSTIFERTKKTFISFLDINRLTLTFTNNLKPEYMDKPEADKLREAIYECQKRFIEKVNNSSKNLSQILNSITSQLTVNPLPENRNNKHNKEILHFLSFTINYVSIYPSQACVPKETVIATNKMKHTPELLSETYHPIESLFYLKHQFDEVLTPQDKSEIRRGDLLLCPPDVAYPILANNLSVLKTLIEHTKGEAGAKVEEFKTLTLFILHCRKLNNSLIYRRDTTLLSIVTSFFRKILSVCTKENISKQCSGLLLYFIFSFLKKTQETWSIGTLGPYTSNLTQKLPNDAIQILEKQKDLSTEDTQALIKTFESIDYTHPNDLLQEFETFVDVIATHLKQSNSALKPDFLKEDFDEMQMTYSGNLFISVDEGDSVDHTKSILVSGTPKPVPLSSQSMKRTHQKNGSLADIYSIQQGSVIRNGNISKNDESHNSDSQASSFVDHSFEQKLKTAKQNKIHNNNLTNILNNQI